MKNPTTKPLNIHNIRIDGNTQSRVSINQDAVAEYAQAIQDDGALPSITVYFDGAEYWLADGFHRYHAHLSLGRASIIAEIRKGTQRDAILHSLGANTHHGLRPTNEDKRKAVGIMLADPEWAELSDRAIARHCGCGHPLVAAIRNPPKPSGRNSTDGADSGGSKNGPGRRKEAKGAKPDPQSAPQTPATEPAASGISSTQEEAHGDDSDPVALLEAAYKELDELRALLAAAEADDTKAEVIKWKRLTDVAQRRQNEMMDTVNQRERELKRQSAILRRICTAMGEDDITKIAAVVEAMARKDKVAA